MSTPVVPSLENTYKAGIALQLYLHPPPDRPVNEWCDYKENAPLMTDIVDRLNASITHRVPLPSTPADISITLDKRLVSSMRRIPHVWTARVQGSSTDTVYPPVIVAKIYDPVYVDSADAEYADPFALLDLTVSREVEAYRRLERLQGTKVPRFYGHFVAPLPTQRDRTVNVILLEYIRGRDLRDLVPPEATNTLCSEHKDAVIDASLRLYFDIYACGVVQRDMQPRNVIMRPPRRRDGRFCSTEGCPLRLEADREDVQAVMVDFEVVDFEEPDVRFSDRASQQDYIDAVKSEYLGKWLENTMP
ncbi:hypothetical protein A0H81_01326 [Grifola frondosa]|uniref:Protein kinase domain-containing protein n=1 Tax=Grifola frondosa TaxID=5627 RepID=A0A1C7MSC1_GRIFR|nr:hypothetical protein A0H81_01326 [Grifola frondosa]